MKVYRSRKSILLGAFIWGVLLLPLLIDGNGIIFLSFYTLILGFVAIIWFGIAYKINDSLLWIMIGPLCVYKIAIDEIQSVNRSYNPLSSPAASLRRMLVTFKGGEILISPKNEKKFVAHLKEINPTIYCGISWEKENESIFTRFVYAIL
ncbi:PH domain-containing protein [Ekhidna sp.]|uniref:PH domain-containing protein n=1 Tax=Ekhidna sp. TaxID=2608089 RepID=UPI003CCB9463